MRIQIIGAVLCAVLFGAGCTAAKPVPIQLSPQSNQANNRVVPLPPTEPTGTPQVPDAAKNIPRPVMR